MTLDGEQGRVELPIAVAADRDDDGRIVELRDLLRHVAGRGDTPTARRLLQPGPKPSSCLTPSASTSARWRRAMSQRVAAAFSSPTRMSASPPAVRTSIAAATS